MMKCPKCEKLYYADIAFCLDDGTPLITETAEQETVLKTHYPPPSTFTISCSVCGLANKANSKFCQKCGAVFPFQDEQPFTPQIPPSNMAAGPGFTVDPDPTSSSSTNKNLLIAVLSVLSLMLIGVILFMASGRGIFVRPDDPPVVANNINNTPMAAVNDNTNVTQKNKTKTPVNKPEDLDLDMGDAPPSYPSALPNGKERSFRGYSSVPLTLYLTRNGSSLTGRAITPGDMDYLDGNIDTDGNFELNGDNDREGYVTGVWRGRVNPDGSIKGVWTSNSGKRIPFSAN